VNPPASPRTRRLRYLAVVLTTLFGTVASLGVFLVIGSWEYRVAEINFEDHARDRLRIMVNEFQDSSRLLYTLRAYIASAEHPVSRAEYIRFSATLHGDVVSLRDTGWAPRITSDERADFEREVQASGVPGFQITERDSTGKVKRAEDRPEYFPILFSEGDSDPLRVVGLDVAFEPVRRSAIRRTIATGKPAATPPVRLLTAPGARGGFMSFLALTGTDDAGVRGDQAEASLTKGVVLGAFGIVAMIDNIVTAKAMLNDLDVYFFEPGAGLDDPANYQRQVRPVGPDTATQRTLLARTHWSGTVPIMDQQWTAIFVPTLQIQRVSWRWQTTMALVIGLTMTAMIAAYLLISLRRTAQLEALTASLNQTTDDLRHTVDKVTHMARHDLLTGVPNRVLFKERLDEAVAYLGRGRPFSLLFLDLDQFKAVNDTLGHAAGDQLLCRATERMRKCLREIDTLGRLGGDEFAVILPDVAVPSEAGLLARRLIAVVSQPYDLDGHATVIGASVGIAIAPDDGAEAEVLQIRADLALYAAKNAGRGRAAFYDANLGATIDA
jgi:diguanylate cyclase (GGDEF)-like protein